MHQVKILRLNSGEDVVANVLVTMEGHQLHNPMVVNIDHSSPKADLMMHHFLPVQIISKNIVVMANNSILCEIQPSSEFEEYYNSTVMKIADLLRAKNIIDELSNENYDDVMEAMEEITYGNKIIH